MIGKIAGEIFSQGISSLNEKVSSERGNINTVFKRIAGHPVKIIASFLSAPILIAKIAWQAKNPTRRFVAFFGLLLSILLAYGAATLIGSLVGALFIASHVGILVGIGFFLGTGISIYLSVIFSILTLNSVAFLFLKLSSQDVLDYLSEIST